MSGVGRPEHSGDGGHKGPEVLHREVGSAVPIGRDPLPKQLKLLDLERKRTVRDELLDVRRLHRVKAAGCCEHRLALLLESAPDVAKQQAR